VVVTHDPRLERFADRVIRVEDGRIDSISHSH
jgi:ABC-type lipoprotein export system ATPase subunit